MDFLAGRYRGSLARMLRDDPGELRKGFLLVNGIGPETPDSIILSMQQEKPVFVVDAYMKRIFTRHGLVSERAGYDEVQQLFMDCLPGDAGLSNEYHALLVKVGKIPCKKRAPQCPGCPLSCSWPNRKENALRSIYILKQTPDFPNI